MNALQLSQQFVSSLSPANFKWPTGNREAVLSRVVVGPAPPDFFQQDFVAPAAILHVEQGRHSDEHPADLTEEARWTLFLFAANASEQSGSAAVVGGNREGLDTSRGRGLLEIEGLVKTQIFTALGLTARARVSGAQPTAYAGKMGGVVAERALEIVATRIPALPDYAPVRRLKATGGGGSVALTWAAAPSRYDLVGYSWARSAVAFPTDPTVATFVADKTATGLNDAPGAGVWFYTIWWAFDATVDPFTGTGVVPVAPNAWSSQQSAQAGLVYLPATVQVAA